MVPWQDEGGKSECNICPMMRKSVPGYGGPVGWREDLGIKKMSREDRKNISLVECKSRKNVCRVNLTDKKVCLAILNLSYLSFSSTGVYQNEKVAEFSSDVREEGYIGSFGITILRLGSFWELNFTTGELQPRISFFFPTNRLCLYRTSFDFDFVDQCTLDPLCFGCLLAVMWAIVVRTTVTGILSTKLLLLMP